MSIWPANIVSWLSDKYTKAGFVYVKAYIHAMDAYLHTCIQIYRWDTGVISVVTTLRKGWSVVRIQKGTRFFSLHHKRPDWLWGSPSSLPHGYNTSFLFFFYRGQIVLGVNLTTYIHLAPRLKDLPVHSHTCLQGVGRGNITLHVAAYMCAYRISCLSH